MPMNERRTRPCRTSSPSTKLAVLEATAKQIPWVPRMIAVLMPTTSPREETSGPPELPGLSAASVWMMSSISRPLRARKERPSADTTPVVTVEFEAERVADGDHQLAAAQRLGIAEARGRQDNVLLDPHQRQVGIGIVADDARIEVAAVGRGDREPVACRRPRDCW